MFTTYVRTTLAVQYFRKSLKEQVIVYSIAHGIDNRVKRQHDQSYGNTSSTHITPDNGTLSQKTGNYIRKGIAKVVPATYKKAVRERAYRASENTRTGGKKGRKGRNEKRRTRKLKNRT